ncbi:MAG: hypothetical protein A3J93_04615 [Candidatus Magasanikbacteria bacterium RIFOXYC2_FULL_42_28]|uniref:Cell envelope-related transcriptional attenuator domain-containing protein n=1 Tax=Candidatus Magasanikbacteria bacterium RIFOXYC2_FULL_42_28 TaxID=1798704 RepID=A0A1F6NX61_9BACT|nr:MAG: hypothetical protein A3J93_04615 [Candidatus Magasanikbacteria bacterium RIFOXYC2_FULL_42_28]
MKNKIIILVIILVGIFGWFSVKGIFWYKAQAAERKIIKTQNETIANIINSRRVEAPKEETDDLFGEDKIARVLLIGLDNRIGQKNGHCDAIQLITLDKNTDTITITAVPRGTYSSLPPGMGVTSSDYYVSNSCGLGGLEYGIKQIEKILGVKADYLVTVNFSETLGILRLLRLPTTETLQWLRNRHGYTIGEPQRARNHSTFIKQMLVKFVSAKMSKIDAALQYIVFKVIKTDLSFAQAQKLLDAVAAMDISNHPEKIKLTMKPFFYVADIVYDPEHITEYLDATLGPIRHLLSKNSFTGLSGESVQANLLAVIEKNKNNAEFTAWAWQNNLWLQIENDEMRLSVQYDLLNSHLQSLSDKKEREAVIADYILEMENRGELVWKEKARVNLAEELGYSKQ